MVTRVTAAMAASLASGGTERVGFLNDMIEHTWDYINVIGANMTRETIEPMFAEMLPGPLSSMKFSKIDLGKNPIKFDNIDVHKHEWKNEMKLDIDINWNGDCDIQLQSKIGSFGVKSIKLAGRISLALDPLVKKMPLVSAIQFGFVNPPLLRLDFTGLAGIAEFSLIEPTVYKMIDKVLANLLVLPNRIYIKLDPATVWYDAFQMDLGVLRLTVEKGYGFKVQKQFFKDIPDIYVMARLGAREQNLTKVINNTVKPEWNDVSDWLLTDHDQEIALEAWDSDLTSRDDPLGNAHITVGKLILKGSKASLPLVTDNIDTGSKIDISCQVFDLTPELASFSGENYAGDKHICGVLNILVAGVRNLPVELCEASSYVTVEAFGKKFQTMVVTHIPDALGVDALNPAYDVGFRVELRQSMLEDAPDVKLALINKRERLGTVSIPFEEIKSAKDGIMTFEHALGNGVVMLFRIVIRGLVDKSE